MEVRENTSTKSEPKGTSLESSRDSLTSMPQSTRTSVSRGTGSDSKRQISSRSSSRGDDISGSSATAAPTSRVSTPSGKVSTGTSTTGTSTSTIGTSTTSSTTPTTTTAATASAPRKWVSRGSEAEIKSVGQSRDLIKLSISRKRREFGAASKFSDRDAHDGLVECRPFKNPNFDLTMREAEVGVQGVPQMATASTQTTWRRKVNATTQYEAMELDSAQRALAQRAPQLPPFLTKVVDSYLTLALQQNESINLFAPDFPAQADEEASLLGGKADNVLREIQSFTDLRHSKDKVLACVGWMPNNKGVVAVSCLENSCLEERVNQSGKVRSSLILVWNFVDPIHPQALLEAPSDVTAMKFHPTVPTTLVAGCANGQILYYDLSSSLKGSSSYQPLKDGDANSQRASIPTIPYTVASSIEGSHRTVVADLMWLPSAQEVNKGRRTDQKSGLEKSASIQKDIANGLNTTSSQFISIAPDGQFLLWDIRFKKDIKEMDLFWVPLYRAALTRADMREELTLSAISLVHNQTKLLAATEDGEVVMADWGTVADNPKIQSTILPWHQGPIRSLERSPFFEDIFLTVGDWTVAVWKEGLGTRPLLGSPYSAAAVTVGRWSPTRPGVFYVGHVDGTVDVWDLIDQAHVPTMTQLVAAGAVTSMEFPPSAEHYVGGDKGGKGGSASNQLVVGDEQGTLHLLELPKNLVRLQPSERAWVESFFKLEAERYLNHLSTLSSRNDDA